MPLILTHICVPFHSRHYQKQHQRIRLVELALDTEAWLVMTKAWLYGLYHRGFRGAHLAAAGLTVT